MTLPELRASRIGYGLFEKHPQFWMRIYDTVTDFHPGYTDADPFKIVSVDPERITHTSQKDGGLPYGKVVGGEWDRPKSALTESTMYRGLQKYIETNDPTTYFDAFEERRRAARWKYSGPEAAADRLHDVDSLVESLRTNGYLLQRDLRGNTEEMTGDYAGDVPPELNEVTVAIGRDGTLYYCWMGGAHRLALSRILPVDLEHIPVLVSIRHERWQRIRDRIRHADNVTDVPSTCREYLDHPDLRDIHPSRSRGSHEEPLAQIGNP